MNEPRHHAVNAAKTRRKKLGNLELFDPPRDQQTPDDASGISSNNPTQ